MDGAGAPRGRSARQVADLRDSRIELAKRAGQRRGWTAEVFELYGKPAKKRYKTFVTTWRPAGGTIRVVLVDEADGWVAFFCTDTNATVAEILMTVADRFSLEITIRDCKEVVGAGQQQVRFVRANIGAFHICPWTFRVTEAWEWGRAEGELGNSQESPWDDSSRHPNNHVWAVLGLVTMTDCPHRWLSSPRSRR